MKAVLNQQAYSRVLRRPSFEALLVSVFNQPFAESCKYFRTHVDKVLLLVALYKHIPVILYKLLAHKHARTHTHTNTSFNALQRVFSAAPHKLPCIQRLITECRQTLHRIP